MKRTSNNSAYTFSKLDSVYKAAIKDAMTNYSWDFSEKHQLKIEHIYSSIDVGTLSGGQTNGGAITGFKFTVSKPGKKLVVEYILDVVPRISAREETVSE